MKRKPGPALIVRLKGGLGNQLFEYASARAIAHNKGVPLYFDVESGFSADPFRRSFSLSNLGVRANWLTRFEALALSPPTLRTRYLRRREILRMRWLSEYHDPAIDCIKIFEPLLVDNYLQSPIYFEGTAAMIRRDLNAPLSCNLDHKWDPSGMEDAVCVHARRFPDIRASGVGERVQRYYGAYGIEYYRAAIARITSERPNAKFYLFGDDTAWIRNTIVPICPHAQVVETGSALDDFRIMTRCTHFVMSNSTFSWWAAWLGAKEHSIVCCGATWNQGETRPPRNLLPPAWIRITA